MSRAAPGRAALATGAACAPPPPLQAGLGWEPLCYALLDCWTAAEYVPV